MRLLEHFTFRNHLCLVFELLGSNLYDCIKRNSFKGFAANMVHDFAEQMLQCLSLLHRERIIHCDLKPENILLREPHSTRIKVVDFGSSCFIKEEGIAIFSVFLYILYFCFMFMYILCFYVVFVHYVMVSFQF